MEARWISALGGGRDPLLVLRVSFSVFRVKICRGGASVVVAVPCAIRSSRLQPHLSGNVERLVGVVWSLQILSGYGDLWIVKELHRQFFLLRLQGGCGLLEPFGDFPSATNNGGSTYGRTAAAARRRHGLEFEDEGFLKDLVIIFIFYRMICTV
jgi:hypothetical protein